MNKIGEGNVSQPSSGSIDYRQQLDNSSTKFLQALEEFNRTSGSPEKDHLKNIMDQQMELIRGSIQELNKKGMHKDAMKVSKDYADYIEENSKENYICLHNDLETLRERNRL